MPIATMNLIDPFQFRALFQPAKSFAVVGNAPTILEFENGAKIDAHDVVVRFNRAMTDGLESKIGGRTDILVVNAANSRRLAPPPHETSKPQCIVCYVTPALSSPSQWLDFQEWVGSTPILVTFGPDLIHLHTERRVRTLTNGTYFLLTALRMFQMEKLFVTGFTMFGAKGGASDKYYDDNRPGVGNFHDLDVESRLVAAILAECRAQLEVTPEVAELLGTGKDATRWSGKSTRPSLKMRITGGISWRLINLGIKLRRIAESR